MEDTLLEIKDLYVQFKTGRSTTYALNGVNLTLRNGEALGLVGETGAGKTTTALAAMGLIPKDVGRISGGDVLFHGKSVNAMKPKELQSLRGGKISMIFQNPLTSLNPVFTIEEQIAMSLRIHRRLSKKEAREKAGDLLEMVGIIRSRLDDYPGQLSGGMRQRVGIAAALACNPELLIADEPTTALDVTIQAQILELMKDLQNDRNSALLMITHSLGIISELCEKVAVMYAGRIVEYGTVKEVFHNPTHWYTQGLLGAIPKLTGPREKLANIPGSMADNKASFVGCAFAPRCGHCVEACKQRTPQIIHLGGEHWVECANTEG